MSSAPITAGISVSTVSSPSQLRFRLFVDFWNLQLTLNERHEEECARNRVTHDKIKIDWTKLPQCLVREAAALMATPFTYEGTIVFTSYNSKKAQDKKFHKWATTWL